MAFRRGATIAFLGIVIIFVAALLLAGDRPIRVDCEGTSNPFVRDCTRTDVYGAAGVLGMIMGSVILVVGAAIVVGEHLGSISKHSCPRCRKVIDAQSSPVYCHNCYLPIDWSFAGIGGEGAVIESTNTDPPDMGVR